MRPLIAVAARPLKPGTIAPWVSPVYGAIGFYLDALHRAGGDEAILMPIEISDADAEARLERFDGVLLTGGADVDPAWYADSVDETVYGVDRVRDTFEMALARAAIATGRPVLAICRGLQILNVALGGTLNQHISDTADSHGDVSVLEAGYHPVTLAAGCHAAVAVGGTTVDRCMSLHHQAIETLAPGLRVTGTSHDGVVEAAEHDRGWVVGVQWHPEGTAATDPKQQALFDAFVAQARHAVGF